MPEVDLNVGPKHFVDLLCGLAAAVQHHVPLCLYRPQIAHDFIGNQAFFLLAVAVFDTEKRQHFIPDLPLDNHELIRDKRGLCLNRLNGFGVKYSFVGVNHRHIAVIVLVRILHGELLFFLTGNEDRGFLRPDVHLDTAFNVRQATGIENNGRERIGVQVVVIHKDRIIFIQFLLVIVHRICHAFTRIPVHVKRPHGHAGQEQISHHRVIEIDAVPVLTQNQLDKPFIHGFGQARPFKHIDCNFLNTVIIVHECEVIQPCRLKPGFVRLVPDVRIQQRVEWLKQLTHIKTSFPIWLPF